MNACAHVRRSAAAALAVALVAAGTSGNANASRATPEPTRATGPGMYIVTLAQEPSAVYDGGVAGYTATRVESGLRFDHSRAAVTAYELHLRERQGRLLDRIGNPELTYQMTTAVNGFAARLTGTQVKALRGFRDVELVERSTRQELDTVDSPDFLELTRAWARHGGPTAAGRGTVIGVVDSGIWPENPSFAGVPLSSPGTSGRLAGFHGACQRGSQWDGEDCNDKVISARYYVKGFGANNVAKSEFLSPRDGSGHGSYTASIAAGNDDVAVEIAGQQFGTASGMAPAARIAAYKACWSAPSPTDDGCETSDTVAAINQAVADGVDVLNYSISGAPGAIADSVELAFVNAAAGGVFVAASAGNHGSGAVAHAGPWVTTVGASTHHLPHGSVRLGNGDVHVGAMVSDESVDPARLVLGSSVAAPDAPRKQARRCEIGSLDPAATQDRIVVCDRGVSARVDKSAAVARAGGAAMVLANVSPDSQDADIHSVPTVHVDAGAARALRSYIRANGFTATAELEPGGPPMTRTPQVADFSSRGPSPSAERGFLKPDLTAPGVGVVAAAAPPSSSGRLWDISSGTSMSSAHVAGLAAFVSGVKPQWQPARIKSAMMTSAYDLIGGSGPLTQGAGHVDPSRFLDPGLVYDATGDDWSAFLSGQVKARDLNQPSIFVASMTGRTTVARTVTNVSGRRETFRASVAGLKGIDATVSPATITLPPRGSGTFRVSFETEPGASLGSYRGGTLSWTGQTARTRTRIPVAVLPEALTAPAAVTGFGRSGRLRVGGRSVRSDSIAVRSSGLAGATPTPVSLVPGTFDPIRPRRDADTLASTVEVPAGAEVARFEIDAHNQADDLDLFAYLDGDLVAQSATGHGDEQITLQDPRPGTYELYVSSSSAANGSTTTGQLYTWVVTPGAGGNLTLDPGRVTSRGGNRFEYLTSWENLDMTQRWFGAIRYTDSDHRTLVSIN